MLGNILGSILVGGAKSNPAAQIGGLLFDIITDASKKVAQDPAVREIPAAIAPELQKEMVTEVSKDPRLQELIAIIENQSNKESPLRSRVTVGNIVALIAVLLGAFGYTLSPEDQAQLVLLVTAGATVWGIGYSLYGRWFKSKPIGK